MGGKNAKINRLGTLIRDQRVYLGVYKFLCLFPNLSALLKLIIKMFEEKHSSSPNM